MTWAMSGISWISDPRLKPVALSPLPAWVWSWDPLALLWANPAAAALGGRLLDGERSIASQLRRVGETLPANGNARLERLRGFGPGIGRALTCSCRWLSLHDGTPALLVAAIEPAGPALPLTERVRRLLADVKTPIAVFAEDGTLLEATPAARAQLGDDTTLDSVRASASAGGEPTATEQIGTKAEAVWVVTFGAADPPPPQSADGVAPAASPGAPAPDGRRLPLRFVWRMDAAGRFTVDSDEFVALMGPATRALLGQPWQDIAAAMTLDPDGHIAAALATRDTWSGLSVAWPVDGTGQHVDVELSGLPVVDRERAFRGYRGFGICRDVARLSALAKARDGASTAAAADDAAQEQQVGTVDTVENVVVLRPAAVAEPPTPSLSVHERHAFYELSRRLAGRLNGTDDLPLASEPGADPTPDPNPDLSPEPNPDPSSSLRHRPDTDEAPVEPDLRRFLDGLPIGVLVYRADAPLYANAAFLRFAGSDNLETLAQAGGLDRLLGPGAPDDARIDTPFVLASPRDPAVTVQAYRTRLTWQHDSAQALLTIAPDSQAGAHAAAQLAEMQTQVRERDAVLDIATDGVIMLDRTLQVLSANRSAQALFGRNELAGLNLRDLLAADNVATATAYLHRLEGTGVGSLLEGCEVIGREARGGAIALFMTIGRLGDTGDRFCAVFRDVTPWKKAEQDITAARHEAERASSAKSEFLAKVSHEIRTPLNAIIGFSELMMDERLGAIENDRYKQYVRDIHASGTHLMSLVNDLLDLSKIEAGKFELAFDSVSLNELTRQCVAMVQPQAARERVIIRSALSPKEPQITADARSVRQIVLNLLSNSIKFTVPGGQVIVSTAMTGTGEVALRIRDTGIGMSEEDIALALEPFRQVATATRTGGTGLGLPLTKALAEANHASFAIRSAPKEGTLVEIVFPAVQVLALSGGDA